MEKYLIQVEEKLTYTREIEIFLPEDMDESDLEDILDDSDGNGSLQDYVYLLKRRGILVKTYDDDCSSPDSQEVECYDYRKAQSSPL